MIDVLYMRQMWAGNAAMLMRLMEDDTPLGRARLDYFLLNKDPGRGSTTTSSSSRAPGKPEAGNFYPAGATKAEVEAWMDGLPEAERKAATGFFTTIRRDTAGQVRPCPTASNIRASSPRWRACLRAAAALTAAADAEGVPGNARRSFPDRTITTRATSRGWSSTRRIEPTIGPYEVYEDELVQLQGRLRVLHRAADPEATGKLARFSGELQELEDHLPIDPKYRRAKLGGLAPIRVVNVVFTAGDGNHGVQTAAFNLPNDERVVAEKGSKRMMLKNFQQAKFDKVLVPISKVALAPADRELVAFEPFFTHILMHELMHGLGPHHHR